jgi:hypothetical protein
MSSELIIVDISFGDALLFNIELSVLNVSSSSLESSSDELPSSS